MEFKEFSEYDNPEVDDYDIISSRNDDGIQYKSPAWYGRLLLNLTGFVEDINDVDMMKDFGITVYEYEHPTEEVVNKVREHLQSKRHR